MFKKTIGFLCLVVALSSCFQTKDIVYLNNLDFAHGDTLQTTNHKTYLLQPSDMLYVRVRSLDESINIMFNNSGSNSTSTFSAAGGPSLYITSYSVNDSGQIFLPIIGALYVKGFTIEQVRAEIKKAASKYLTGADIDVKLVSYKISILGEIKAPGQYTVFNNRANVFEVISMAGDISYYGNRKNILILRALDKGTKVITVDLTDKSILKSELYYLQPNDVIYVQPLKTTLFRTRISEYSTIITAFSTVITTVLLLAITLKK